MVPLVKHELVARCEGTTNESEKQEKDFFFFSSSSSSSFLPLSPSLFPSPSVSQMLHHREFPGSSQASYPLAMTTSLLISSRESPGFSSSGRWKLSSQSQAGITLPLTKSPVWHGGGSAVSFSQPSLFNTISKKSHCIFKDIPHSLQEKCARFLL